MNRRQLVALYDKRKTDFADQLRVFREKINTVSNVRILVAVVFFALLYVGFTDHELFFVSLLPVAGFAWLMQYHSTLFRQKIHLESLVTVNSGEIQSLTGDSSCYDTGMAYLDPHHPYAHDLDIFGDGSLFQAINRANTIHGKASVAQRLSAPLDAAEKITTQQQAVRELAEKIEFRQHFQAAGLETGEQVHDRSQLLDWLRVPAFIFGTAYFRTVLILLPAATIGCIVAAFFVPLAKPAAMILALSQWVVLSTYLKRVNALHETVSQKKSILEKYAHILYFVQREDFTSPLLKDLSLRARQADTRIKSLASLVSALNARLNFLTNVFVNSVLMYDLQCVYRLEKWKHENAGNLERWLNVISETEVLCSLGTFSFNHPAFVFPEIGTELAIASTALGHPLIPEEESVPNDVILDHRQSILIITGANMAGKSTFLRSLGVNLVLALSGGPVCARTFRCPVITLRSGMRTADSLKDHQSYFYAELNRLKTIMDDLRSDKPLLILLDEILKGTNSTDKQLGSIALVRQLIPHPCLAVIATHDLALGELAEDFPDQVKNYCFEATIADDKLSFDYTLRPGLARKMNATFLMKKMGIIPSDNESTLSSRP